MPPAKKATKKGCKKAPAKRKAAKKAPAKRKATRKAPRSARQRRRLPSARLPRSARRPRRPPSARHRPSARRYERKAAKKAAKTTAKRKAVRRKAAKKGGEEDREAQGSRGARPPRRRPPSGRRSAPRGSALPRSAEPVHGDRRRDPGAPGSLARPDVVPTGDRALELVDAGGTPRRRARRRGVPAACALVVRSRGRTRPAVPRDGRRCPSSSATDSGARAAPRPCGRRRPSTRST